MRKKVSWEEVHTLCENISNTILKRKLSYDTILAITRGGLIPAAILSHILNIIDIRTISVNSYDKSIQKDEVELIQYPNPYVFMGRKVLVVDEIVQSGRTMSHVFKFFKVITEQGLAEFSSAVLFYKNPSPYPDFYGAEIDAKIWIDFPWEV